MTHNPDECKYYPDCPRLEPLLADPPIGPISVSLPKDAEPICGPCDQFEPRRRAQEQ